MAIKPTKQTYFIAMSKKVLVIGGTGYIGTPLVKKLKKEGYDLTLLVRDKKDFREEFAGCRYFVADLLDKKSLEKSIKDFDLVINLAAVIRALDKKKYQENILGMKNLIEIMENKGIKRMIFFSTQNVNLRRKGPYAKSKEEAEKILLSSKLDYMIIRPNYVYGVDRFNDFFRMTQIARKFRILPLIGKGNYKIQPILKEDLIEIVFNFVENFQAKSIVEISGPESISIKEIGKLAKECLKSNCVIVSAPVFLFKILKNFIPFDVDGYTEDRISKKPFSKYKFSSFRENLKKIIDLVN